MWEKGEGVPVNQGRLCLFKLLQEFGHEGGLVAWDLRADIRGVIELAIRELVCKER